jgi:hypothetical protein
MKALAQFLPIQSAIDPKTGRYDARQLAQLLDWTSAEVAQYLERSPAMIATSPTAPTLQDKLATLAALFRDLVELFTVPDEKDIDPDVRAYMPFYDPKAEHMEPAAAARAWLRTPIRSLDNQSAKARILAGRIDWVVGLVESLRDGVGY